MSESEEFSGVRDGVWSGDEIFGVVFWFAVALIVLVVGVSALWLGRREGKEAQAKAAQKKRAERIRNEGGGVAF